MGLVARLVCACPGIIVMVGVLFALASIWIVATRFNVVNKTSPPEALFAEYFPEGVIMSGTQTVPQRVCTSRPSLSFVGRLPTMCTGAVIVRTRA